ncbi:PAS domain S-box protein [Flavihumibacter sediminis]|nr:PAS domain S-box protein [Flavihumibacter sediminis]
MDKESGKKEALFQIDTIENALSGGGIGLWKYHPSDRVFHLNSEAAVLFGQSHTVNLSLEDFVLLIESGYRQPFQDKLERFCTRNGSNIFHFQLYAEECKEHQKRCMLELRGKIKFDSDGRVNEFSGVALQVPEPEPRKYFPAGVPDPGSPDLRKTLAQRDSIFVAILDSSPTGLWLSDEDGNIIFLNRTLQEWTGMEMKDLLGTGWANAIIEEDRDKSAAAFAHAVATRSHYDVVFRIRKGDGNIIWCRAAGDPYYHHNGEYAGFVGYCMDLNELISGREAVKQSESRFRSIVEQAPMAIGLLKGREMIVEICNDRILEVWGKDRKIIGRELLDALPEIREQGFMELLQHVYDSGEPYYGYSVLAMLERKGILEASYFDFVYTPIRDVFNNITGVMVLATDVTRQVMAKKSIEESEAKFRGLIEEAPFATAVYRGRELIIDMANDAMIQLWGKNKSVIGMPLDVALPELEGQPFFDLLQNVLSTGVPYHAQEQRADLIVNGVLRSFYFNFTYKPLKNIQGEVYAILNMAVDITEQFLARRKVEEAELALRGAVELADLGTWSFDVKSNNFHLSERLAGWMGYEREMNATQAFDSVAEEDKERIIKGIGLALSEESGGLFDDEYQVLNRNTGERRILHAQGKTIFNDEGEALKITGTAQDVTRQREIQGSLEAEVYQRTEELAAAIEELQATNEELAESNIQLSRSNEELAQYAYVASHDLQEPLRKIRLFSDMLKNKTRSPEDQRIVIEKINNSAERMSTLIQSLLEFSRLLKSDNLMQQVDIQSTLDKVITDFELAISEKNAVVRVGKLPVIEAIGLQMNQLFYNLFSNALKFTVAHRIPEISITAEITGRKEAEKLTGIELFHENFHHFRFIDNGIGIEPEYRDQIFEVFRKLHARDLYQGSGIGLSICRRIITNHNGIIFVESVPGQFTCFHILLPITNRP